MYFADDIKINLWLIMITFILQFILADSSLLTHADYTLCLDDLASDEFHDIYVHVSKPPKIGSRGYDLVQAVNQVINLECLMLFSC